MKEHFLSLGQLLLGKLRFVLLCHLRIARLKLEPSGYLGQSALQRVLPDAQKLD